MSIKTNKSFYKRNFKTKNFIKISRNYKNHLLTKKKKKRKKKLKKKIYNAQKKII
ncbi:50S ribosomal protein L35 [Candidatus Vidania fulgoroideorum]